MVAGEVVPYDPTCTYCSIDGATRMLSTRKRMCEFHHSLMPTLSSDLIDGEKPYHAISERRQDCGVSNLRLLRYKSSHDCLAAHVCFSYGRHHHHPVNTLGEKKKKRTSLGGIYDCNTEYPSPNKRMSYVQVRPHLQHLRIHVSTGIHHPSYASQG